MEFTNRTRANTSFVYVNWCLSDWLSQSKMHLRIYSEQFRDIFLFMFCFILPAKFLVVRNVIPWTEIFKIVRIDRIFFILYYEAWRKSNHFDLLFVSREIGKIDRKLFHFVFWQCWLVARSSRPCICSTSQRCIFGASSSFYSGFGSIHCLILDLSFVLCHFSFLNCLCRFDFSSPVLWLAFGDLSLVFRPTLPIF